MSGFISISNTNNLPENTIHEITEFICVNNTLSFIDIKFKVSIKKESIFKIYLYINKVKQDITNNVNHIEAENYYSYSITDTNYNTEYRLQLEIIIKNNKSIKSKESVIRTKEKEISKIYGVSIDESNSNPKTSVSYINDAVGIEPASNRSLIGWLNKFPYNKIKIVGFKNGKETGEIDKNNKKKYINGEFVTDDVDVMVKIPKVYWSINQHNQEIKICETKISEDFECYAHKINALEKNYIYIGVYLASGINGKLRSVSGKTPFFSNLKTLRSLAHNNGNGYQLFNLHTMNLIQILYLIAFKNLNSENALGEGKRQYRLVETGSSDQKGFIYGNNFNTDALCFLGIEDLWGNLRQWIDGIFINNNMDVQIIQDNKSFEDNGVGYKTILNNVNSFGSIQYIDSVTFSKEFPFCPTGHTGSTNTYYCDGCNLESNSGIAFGGDYYQSGPSGIFSLCSYPESEINNLVGARLCYLG